MVSRAGSRGVYWFLVLALAVPALFSEASAQASQKPAKLDRRPSKCASRRHGSSLIFCTCTASGQLVLLLRDQIYPGHSVA